MPGEWSVKGCCVMSDNTYWDINTIHVHIPLCCLMHGLTIKFVVGGANLMLRYIVLSNSLSLLKDLGSLLCMVQTNRRMIIGGTMEFIKGVDIIIINKKLCCAD